MLNVCNVLMVKRKAIEVIRVNRSNESSKRVVAIEEHIRKSDILQAGCGVSANATPLDNSLYKGKNCRQTSQLLIASSHIFKHSLAKVATALIMCLTTMTQACITNFSAEVPGGAAHFEKVCSWTQDSSECVTINAHSNASGTIKLPLLVIGKSKNPRCFKNVRLDHLPVVYANQSNHGLMQPC